MVYPSDYFLIAILVVLLISVSSQSLERVVKIIIGNYILVAISMGVSSGIDFLKYFIINIQVFFKIANLSGIVSFLDSRKIWINLILYFVVLILIMMQSKISIGSMDNKIKRIIMKIILCPLSVLITLVALEVVILGYKIFDVNSLLQSMAQYKINGKLYYFLLLTPLWIIMSGLITVIVSLKINMNISFKKSGTAGGGGHHEESHAEHHG